jgi:hypothetical protein
MRRLDWRNTGARVTAAVLFLAMVGCGAAQAGGADEGSEDRGGAAVDDGDQGNAAPIEVHVGDLVLGRWKSGPYWYPANVAAVREGAADLRYLDGDNEATPLGRIRAFNWQVGTSVACNWKGGGKYYPGKIANIQGMDVNIDYDDGDKEATKVAACRSQR